MSPSELIEDVKRSIIFKHYNFFIGVFSYLILKAEIEVVEETSSQLNSYAYTDGEKIYIPKDVSLWNPERIAIVVLHEILHSCREDFSRAKDVESPELWNQVSDAYINTWLSDAGFPISSIGECITRGDFADILGEDWIEKYTTEQAYYLLIKNGVHPTSVVSHSKSLIKHDVEKAKEWEKEFENAVNYVGYGDIPEEGKSLVKEILREEPLDIRLLLSSFFRSIIPEDYSHVEYDKVLWANGGLYLPGIAGENATKILFCIDVSGSISVKEAKRFVDIAYATIRRYGIHKADFLYFDTEIKKIEKGKEDFTTFTYSGGGTSFVPIFHFLEENEYDATIILTDGYGDYPVDSSSRTEVFFAIKFGGNINRAKKYGVVAQLPRW